MRTWIVATAAALVASIGAALVLTGPAGASGDPSLDRAIAITPPAGWVLAPASVSDAQAARQEQIVGAAAQLQFTFASKEWTQPNSTNQLTVALWAYAPKGIGQVKTRVNLEKETCGQGQIAVTGSVAGVAGSKETSCSTPPPGGSTSGATPTTYAFTTIGWFDGDTYATVHAIGLPSSQVAAYARQVAAAIPAGGVSAGSSSSSTSDRPLIGVGAAAVLAALAVVVVLRRRRRATGYTQPLPSTAAAPSPAPAYVHAGAGATASDPMAGVTRQPTEAMPPLPTFRQSPTAASTAVPGWHPVPGDPTKTAYWDGTQWAAFRQWDGHQWVDAAALHR
jgi:hypothetical protein